MALVERFEDLHAWKKAKEVSVNVYRLTAHGSFQRDWGLRDQLRRSAVSIMANIAEGFGRQSRKDFSHFLVMARASCFEMSSHLYLAEEIGYIDNDVAKELRRSVNEVARIIGGLRESLKPARNAGLSNSATTAN